MPTPREGRILLRVSDKERKKLDAAAERMGLTLSGWLRLVALAAAEAQGKGKGK